MTAHAIHPLADELRESLHTGLLFGHFDEPLDSYGKRLVRVIASRLEADHAALVAENTRLSGLFEKAMRLAREGANGWACFAKTKREHDDIARIHQELNALRAALQPAEGER